MAFFQLIFVYGFLPLLLLAYFIRKQEGWRRGVLLAFSMLFYAWGEPVYLLLLLGSAAMNYIIGRMIGAGQTQERKKLSVVLGIVLNLALLAVFKYSGFAVETLNGILGLQIPVPKLSLPVGISFYTFQALTYIIDVYREYCPPQKSFSKLLLYISLFPKVGQGPIMRYTDIESQLSDRSVSAAQVNHGLYRFAIGLGKKMLFSNACGLACQYLLHGDVMTQETVMGNWMGIFFYSLQIYFDFSGYSDMAIGLGHMVGFIIPENFNYPYISSSIAEYWRRWHITLGSWFRDYLFYPVLRSRVITQLAKKLKKSGHKAASRSLPTILGLLIVWFSTGLWHGASWNFVLWGLYYGLWLILEQFVLDKLLDKLPKRARKLIGHVTFVPITLVGYAFFYFQNDLFTNLGKLFGVGVTGFTSDYVGSVLYENGFLVIAALICVTPLGHLIFDKFRAYLARVMAPEKAYTTERIIKTVIILVLLILCTFRMAGDTFQPSIYRDF